MLMGQACTYNREHSSFYFYKFSKTKTFIGLWLTIENKYLTGQKIQLWTMTCRPFLWLQISSNRQVFYQDYWGILEECWGWGWWWRWWCITRRTRQWYVHQSMYEVSRINPKLVSLFLHIFLRETFPHHQQSFHLEVN